MGDALRREVTTTRVEYVLRSPTNATEVSKAISWALQDLAASQGQGAAGWDDALEVSSRDEEIVISWSAPVDPPAKVSPATAR